MKIALVCIAKNEDNYIQEWIDYNKKLGFDDIVIYQNDWKCNVDDSQVIKIDFNGVNRQVDAYNHFIKTNIGKYDWAAFLDIDEYLVLKKHKNIKEFIQEYSDYNSIGINWCLFGDNGLEGIDGEYSVLKRFTKRQSSINQHIKSIVKLTSKVIMGVHNPDCFWVDPNKKTHMGPFNKDGDDTIAIINHYFVKTKEEFLLKCEKGRADAPSSVKRNMSEFDPHNFNEVEDLNAFNFLYGNNNILNS
jgi:hypothetical protein